MSQKIKILYLNYYSIPDIKSGKEKIDRFSFSYRFLHHFKSKYEIKVIDSIGENDDFIKDGIQFHFREKLNNSRFKLPKAINKEIVEMAPDVILLQGFRFIHFADIIKKRLPNTRLIVQHHAEQVPSSKFKQSLLKSFNTKVEAYIFSSKELAGPWIGSGIINKTQPIIELPEIATNFERGDIDKIPNSFIWVGRLDSNKDPLTMIKGIAPYFKKYPDARLRMFFHVNTLKDFIVKEIKKLDIESQVELVGEIPNDKLEIQYQQSQLFLLSSHYEGGSLALMESMACGCIPIVSDIPANRNFTGNGEIGFLFIKGNSDDLADKLKYVSECDVKNESQKVRAYFESHLSAKAIAKGIMKYLKNGS